MLRGAGADDADEAELLRGALSTAASGAGGKLTTRAANRRSVRRRRGTQRRTSVSRVAAVFLQRNII
jgi:hypothetical protein